MKSFLIDLFMRIPFRYIAYLWRNCYLKRILPDQITIQDNATLEVYSQGYVYPQSIVIFTISNKTPLKLEIEYMNLAVGISSRNQQNIPDASIYYIPSSKEENKKFISPKEDKRIDLVIPLNLQNYIFEMLKPRIFFGVIEFKCFFGRFKKEFSVNLICDDHWWKEACKDVKKSIAENLKKY